MGLILDTSVLVAAERRLLQITAFLLAQPIGPVRLAAVTYSELLHGLERAASAQIRTRRRKFIEGILSLTGIAGFNQREAEFHARLWAGLESRGQTIGPHELQIAATALSLDFALATLNIGEFSRVPGLILADVRPFQIAK
jgi:tRNA(fMet)-specific endonuclease VapC